ncbi:hypothetical protein Hamer_G023112 [Homarus americanus]|uniref:Uncharacterized protein n=1 Tax=Homarus americanus TaxID=6706 RepID=A0A8J5T0Y6_HOMAM|nr:hypothetical protein Hamer_G023112 [Homarus americanus]
MTVIVLLLSGTLNLWEVATADPQRLFGPDSPIIVVPGTATWGDSSAASGPISLGGMISSNLVSVPQVGYFRGSVTYGTSNVRWVGKATPIFHSPSTRVISTSFSVVGGRPDYRIFDPYGSANGTPTVRPPVIQFPTTQTPTVQPPAVRPPVVQFPSVRPPFAIPLPTRHPAVRPPILPYPSPTLVMWNYRRRTPFPYFPTHGYPRRFNPQGVFFRALQSGSPNLHTPEQRARASTLFKDETDGRTGSTEPMTRFQGDKSEIKTQGLSFPSFNYSKVTEKNRPNSHKGNLDELTASSEEKIVIDKTFKDIRNSSVDQKDIEEAIKFSSQKTISVNERQADDENFVTDPTVSSVERSSEKNPGTTTLTVTLQDNSQKEDLPDDKIVIASIDVKPLEDGTVVAYYEDLSASPYASLPKDPVNRFSAGHDSFSNTTRKPKPQYIIVRDSKFNQSVTVLDIDREAAGSGSDDNKGMDNINRNSTIKTDDSFSKSRNHPPSNNMSNVDENGNPFSDEMSPNYELGAHLPDEDVSTVDENSNTPNQKDESSIEHKVHFPSRDVSPVDENSKSSSQKNESSDNEHMNHTPVKDVPPNDNTVEKDKDGDAEVVRGTTQKPSSFFPVDIQEDEGTSSSSSIVFTRHVKTVAFGQGILVTLLILL